MVKVRSQVRSLRSRGPIPSSARALLCLARAHTAALPVGEVDYDSHISRRGDGQLRAHLYEAASVLLTRVCMESGLRGWGLMLGSRSASSALLLRWLVRSRWAPSRHVEVRHTVQSHTACCHAMLTAETTLILAWGPIDVNCLLLRPFTRIF